MFCTHHTHTLFCLIDWFIWRRFLTASERRAGGWAIGCLSRSIDKSPGSFILSLYHLYVNKINLYIMVSITYIEMHANSLYTWLVDTSHTLTGSMPRSTRMAATKILFVRFILIWATFELWANFVKSAPNDSKMTWHIHIPTRPKFSSVLLYDEPFLSYDPF